jgi:hypothetical protein
MILHFLFAVKQKVIALRAEEQVPGNGANTFLPLAEGQRAATAERATSIVLTQRGEHRPKAKRLPKSCCVSQSSGYKMSAASDDRLGF